MRYKRLLSYYIVEATKDGDLHGQNFMNFQVDEEVRKNPGATKPQHQKLTRRRNWFVQLAKLGTFHGEEI